MNPKDFRFHKEHDWVQVDGDTALFGITDYAQKTLGDIVYVELPEVGTEVVANEPYAEVESVKAVSDVYSPLSGTVVQINEEAVEAPEIINKAPYDEGWLVRVRYSNPAELDALMSFEEYEQMIAQTED